MKKIDHKKRYNLFLKLLLCVSFISTVSCMNNENFIDQNTPGTETPHKDNSEKKTPEKVNKNQENIHLNKDKNENLDVSQSMSDNNDDSVMDKNEVPYIQEPNIGCLRNEFPGIYLIERGSIDNQGNLKANEKTDSYFTPNQQERLIARMNARNKALENINSRQGFMESGEFVLQAEEMNFYKCIDLNEIDLGHLMLFSDSFSLPKSTRKKLAELMKELFDEIINRSNFSGKENFDKMIDNKRIFTCKDLSDLVLDIESIRRSSQLFVTRKERDELYNSFLKFKNLIENIRLECDDSNNSNNSNDSDIEVEMDIDSISNIEYLKAKFRTAQRELERQKIMFKNMIKDFYETISQKDELMRRLNRCLKIMEKQGLEIKSLREQNEDKELQLAIAMSMQDGPMMGNNEKENRQHNTQENVGENSLLQQNKVSGGEHKPYQQINDDSSFEEYDPLKGCEECGNKLTSRQVKDINEEDARLSVENLILQENNAALRKKLNDIMNKMGDDLNEETCAIIISMQEDNSKQGMKSEMESEFVVQNEASNNEENTQCNKCGNKFTIDQIQNIKEKNKYLRGINISLKDDHEALNELMKKVDELQKTNTLSKNGNNKMQDEGDELL